MSWSLSASGHVDSKEEEAEVIEVLRKAIKEVNASSVQMGTQHHGTVNLLAEAPE